MLSLSKYLKLLLKKGISNPVYHSLFYWCKCILSLAYRHPDIKWDTKAYYMCICVKQKHTLCTFFVLIFFLYLFFFFNFPFNWRPMSTLTCFKKAQAIFLSSESINRLSIQWEITASINQFAMVSSCFRYLLACHSL